MNDLVWKHYACHVSMPYDVASPKVAAACPMRSGDTRHWRYVSLYMQDHMRRIVMEVRVLSTSRIECI